MNSAAISWEESVFPGNTMSEKLKDWSSWWSSRNLSKNGSRSPAPLLNDMLQSLRFTHEAVISAVSSRFRFVSQHCGVPQPSHQRNAKPIVFLFPRRPQTTPPLHLLIPFPTIVVVLAQMNPRHFRLYPGFVLSTFFCTSLVTYVSRVSQSLVSSSYSFKSQ